MIKGVNDRLSEPSAACVQLVTNVLPRVQPESRAMKGKEGDKNRSDPMSLQLCDMPVFAVLWKGHEINTTKVYQLEHWAIGVFDSNDIKSFEGML